MTKNLVIVESPAKAKTIEGFLGKDFTVKSSYGHVRDLSEKNLSVDIEKGFIPKYEVSSDKKKIVSELKDLSQKAEMVWLASDEDREGEAISWHLYETLGLEEDKTRRIVFNEITKSAITKAIENPRKIDLNLVNAQQARRVLDRLVGYELSPILWKKIKPSLSAGRVQSVTVRLLVERERERKAFESKSFFRITADFNTTDGKRLKTELDKRFDTEKEVLDFLDKCKSASFTVESVETKPAKKSPSAPFTTSTLQQEAGRKLGFSVLRTMSLAQKLYEEGRITYMRTDSVNLSDTALDGSKATILNNYGNKYHKRRQFSTKSKGAQEAHEAIRPTDFNAQVVTDDSAAQKLYDLIWKRSIASQMADAELEKTTITIQISNRSEKLIAKGEVIKFDGFLKVYIESSDEESEDENDQLLPKVSVSETLNRKFIKAVEKFTQPPPRYTEASLVKKLEELGIGRPSTYAPTITTVQKRGYVEKKDFEGHLRNYRTFKLDNDNVEQKLESELTGADKSKLVPTDIGNIVTDFLVENFTQVLDYNFTAQVEKDFDNIAEGSVDWKKMLDEFYRPFHKTVEYTEKNSERIRGKRLLGVDEKSGKNVYAQLGRYGPMIVIGEAEDEEKPKFSSLKADQSLETITLEEALDLFKLPRTLGSFEENDVIVNSGRFGPYIKHGSKNYNLPKQFDPMIIGLGEAIKLIEEKRVTDTKKIIKEFPESEIKILNGQYGPYIAKGKNNFKIPKDKVPAELTLEEVETIINTAPEKKKKPFGRKK
jgi:DNA topoisomerase-1